MTELLKSIDPELFDGKNINVMGTPDEPLFFMREICAVLGYKNSYRIYKQIPEEFKQKIMIGNSEHSAISKNGLYWVIIKCNKPNAKKLQEFICKTMTEFDK